MSPLGDSERHLKYRMQDIYIGEVYIRQCVSQVVRYLVYACVDVYGRLYNYAVVSSYLYKRIEYHVWLREMHQSSHM